MSIEIYFVRQLEGEWVQDGDEQASIGSVGSLFNLALLLGHVVKSLEPIEDPDIQKAMAEFSEYVNDKRDEKLASFDGFVEFVNKTVEEMKAKGEPWDGFDQELDPADFDPDVRAYLGGFLISGEPIEPAHCLRLTAFTGYALAALTSWAEQLKENDSDGAEEIVMVCQTLEPILAFAEATVSEDRLMYVEC